jgi:hypothetical protein
MQRPLHHPPAPPFWSAFFLALALVLAQALTLAHGLAAHDGDHEHAPACELCLAHGALGAGLPASAPAPADLSGAPITLAPPVWSPRPRAAVAAYRSRAPPVSLVR